MLKRKLLAAVIAASFCGASQAAVDINGFASIKGGIALSSDDELYDYDDNLSFENESLAALQVKSDLGDKLSVTAQIVGRGSEDWDAEFEWAFLSYELTDNLKFNAGRLRTAFYRYSDYLDVGYAYDWARVPRSVYDVTFNSIEGASAMYSNTLGNYDSNVQFSIGTLRDDINTGELVLDGEINNVAGVTWELSQDSHSFRAAYFRGKATINADELDNFMSLLSTQGLDGVAQDIDVKDETAWFMGLGFNLDKNNWVVVSEITKTDIEDSYAAESLSYFLSVGYRFNNLTPFVSFEKDDNKAKTEIYDNLPISSPFYAPVVSLVNSQEEDINSINVGIRYDFHPSAAFKAQYTNADNKTADRKDSILVVGVDLVF